VATVAVATATLASSDGKSIVVASVLFRAKITRMTMLQFLMTLPRDQ